MALLYESGPAPSDLGSGGGPGGAERTERPVDHASNLDATQLIDLLRQEFTRPGIDVYMETKLERAGWLPALEQAGIVPIVEISNPYDPEQEEEKHNQWWEDHPEDANKFSSSLQAREKVLRYLYVGEILDDLTSQRLMSR